MACMQGFQQQDSHELLRVLLDGLQTEEAKAIAAKLKHNSAQQVLPSILCFSCLSYCVVCCNLKSKHLFSLMLLMLTIQTLTLCLLASASLVRAAVAGSCTSSAS